MRTWPRRYFLSALREWGISRAGAYSPLAAARRTAGISTLPGSGLHQPGACGAGVPSLPDGSFRKDRSIMTSATP